METSLTIVETKLQSIDDVNMDIGDVPEDESEEESDDSSTSEIEVDEDPTTATKEEEEGEEGDGGESKTTDGGGGMPEGHVQAKDHPYYKKFRSSLNLTIFNIFIRFFDMARFGTPEPAVRRRILNHKLNNCYLSFSP